MVSYLACLEGGDTIEVTVIGYALVEVWLGVVHLRPSKNRTRKGEEMDYRYLGKSGVKVSPITLGTMMFGGADRRDRSRAGSSTRRASRASTSSTPPTSTTRASRKRSWAAASPTAATIGCWRPSSPTRWATANERGLSRKWVYQAVDASLKRLGTDYIDLIYFHRAVFDAPLEEPVRGARRPDPAGQAALFRRLELPRLAHRRDLAGSPTSSASTGRSPASRSTTSSTARPRPSSCRRQPTMVSAWSPTARWRAAC